MRPLTFVAVISCLIAFLVIGIKEQNVMNDQKARNAANQLTQPDKLIKLDIYNKDILVAHYLKDGRTCQSHIVQVSTNPKIGLFGNVCQ